MESAVGYRRTCVQHLVELFFEAPQRQTKRSTDSSEPTISLHKTELQVTYFSVKAQGIIFFQVFHRCLVELRRGFDARDDETFVIASVWRLHLI
jgi:hypothetical protein